MEYTLDELNQIKSFLSSSDIEIQLLGIYYLMESDVYKYTPLDTVVYGYNKSGLLKADLTLDLIKSALYENDLLGAYIKRFFNKIFVYAFNYVKNNKNE